MKSWLDTNYYYDDDSISRLSGSLNRVCSPEQKAVVDDYSQTKDRLNRTHNHLQSSSAMACASPRPLEVRVVCLFF
jgi:hypothetical protein